MDIVIGIGIGIMLTVLSLLFCGSTPIIIPGLTYKCKYGNLEVQVIRIIDHTITYTDDSDEYSMPIRAFGQVFELKEGDTK